MGFSWKFHWKHFPCLFRMKSYHWQKMNNSFKIVAETVKLVPLKKKESFPGLEISKKKLPSPKNSAATPWPTTPPRFQFIGMFHLQLCLQKAIKIIQNRQTLIQDFHLGMGKIAWFSLWKFFLVFAGQRDMPTMKRSNKNIVLVKIKKNKNSILEIRPLNFIVTKKLCLMSMFWHFIQVSLICSRNWFADRSFKITLLVSN